MSLQLHMQWKAWRYRGVHTQGNCTSGQTTSMRNFYRLIDVLNNHTLPLPSRLPPSCTVQQVASTHVYLHIQAWIHASVCHIAFRAPNAPAYQRTPLHHPLLPHPSLLLTSGRKSLGDRCFRRSLLREGSNGREREKTNEWVGRTKDR